MTTGSAHQLHSVDPWQCPTAAICPEHKLSLLTFLQSPRATAETEMKKRKLPVSAATAHLKQAKLSFGSHPKDAVLYSSSSTESSQTVATDSRQAQFDALADTHPQQQQQQSFKQDATSDDAAQPAAGPGAAARFRTRPKQSYNLFLVYDFEATCDKPAPMPVQELIELACVVLEADSLKVVAEQQIFVRPSEYPMLTDFCRQLTHITQAQVDNGIPLAAALQQHHAWLCEHGFVGPNQRPVAVTWTDWDLKKMLEQESGWRRITVAPYLRSWVDLKHEYARVFNRPGSLKTSVQASGIPWEGHAHSGLVDARHTALLAARLIQLGAVLRVTGSFAGLDQKGRRQTTLLPPGARPIRHSTTDKQGAWNGKCECGVAAHECVVKRPGPNLGRQFWACGAWSLLKGRGCQYFCWADEPPGGAQSSPARPDAVERLTASLN